MRDERWSSKIWLQYILSRWRYYSYIKEGRKLYELRIPNPKLALATLESPIIHVVGPAGTVTGQLGLRPCVLRKLLTLAGLYNIQANDERSHYKTTKVA